MRRHHYPSELRYAGPGDLPRQAAPTGDGVDADRRQQQERGHHVPHVGAVALKAMPLSMAAMTSPPSTACTALPLVRLLMTLVLMGTTPPFPQDQQHHALPAEQTGKRHHE